MTDTTHRPLLLCMSVCGSTMIMLLLLAAVPADAQDRFPRAGEPGAISVTPARRAPTRRQSSPLQADPAANRANLPTTGSTRRPGGGASARTTTRPRPAATNPVQRFEQQDFGVPATATLHAGAMHGPTPLSIPGGKVVSTDQLASAIRSAGNKPLLFHILGAGPALPGAYFAPDASSPGNFSDHTQQRLAQYLQQLTRGNRNQPMVFYCSGPQCWMSYNAALRAIKLGYRSVGWYRGGLRAWQMAGLPLRR